MQVFMYNTSRREAVKMCISLFMKSEESVLDNTLSHVMEYAPRAQTQQHSCPDFSLYMTPNTQRHNDTCNMRTD